MRNLVATAANEAFMPLLRGLVGSLHQWESTPFSGFAVFDLGLGTESRAWLARHGAQLVVPGWDLPVDAQLREQQPHLRAFTARVFLPGYFPGYGCYLWIDADAWVQERSALDWYFAVAASGAMAVAPQVDRSYRHAADLVGWRTQRMLTYFGQDAAERAIWDRYVNAGVFALRGDAPHWQLWAHHFRQGLLACDGRLVCDQTALNQALWVEELAVYPLPALFNWLCHLGAPAFDRGSGKFCEPFGPAAAIGILHLTAHTKDLRLEVPGADGPLSIDLRFPGST